MLVIRHTGDLLTIVAATTTDTIVEHFDQPRNGHHQRDGAQHADLVRLKYPAGVNVEKKRHINERRQPSCFDDCLARESELVSLSWDQSVIVQGKSEDLSLPRQRPVQDVSFEPVWLQLLDQRCKFSVDLLVSGRRSCTIRWLQRRRRIITHRRQPGWRMLPL